MIVQLGMPISRLSWTPSDSAQGKSKLIRMLTFGKKVYNGTDMSIVKVCLLGDNGEFRTGLWDRIRMVGPTMGLPIEAVVDGREGVSHAANIWCMPKLREYQTIAVNQVLEHEMGTLYAATGAGKTYMAAAMIACKGFPTLFLVHTKDLLYQAKESLEELLGIKIGIIGDSEFDMGEGVVVATIQTLSRCIRDGSIDALRNAFDVIIQDETHHVPADTFYDVLGHFKARYVYGLSATPYRKDGADLMIEAGVGPIVARISISELVATDNLTGLEGIFYPRKEETSHSAAPRWAIIKKYLVNNDGRNRDIAKIAKEYMGTDRTVLIAVNQVGHGNNIAQYLPEAVTLYGTDKSDMRKEVLDQFREKKIPVLISTLLREGVDIPSLDVVINAAGGTDLTQLAGRALRKSDGKHKATLIDFIDNGHITLQRSSWARLKKLKGEKCFNVRVES